jgi:hypothetical protein
MVPVRLTAACGSVLALVHRWRAQPEPKSTSDVPMLNSSTNLAPDSLLGSAISVIKICAVTKLMVSANTPDSSFLMIDLPIVIVYCILKLIKPVKAMVLMVWELKNDCRIIPIEYNLEG